MQYTSRIATGLYKTNFYSDDFKICFYNWSTNLKQLVNQFIRVNDVKSKYINYEMF